MTTVDNGQPNNPRYPERPENEMRIIRPAATGNSLFRGWGPKLAAAALAIGTFTLSHQSASAATQIGVTSSCSTADHGASLLSNPIVETPEGVAASGKAVVRVNLAASGGVDSAMIEQSSGDFNLDFAAIRAAEQSQYEPASIACRSVSDTVLYAVTFDNW
jgi:TonB family protein